ncbi:hypothetical protein Leryth_013585 [Lithospermum erythrorhizon]|nr:hypothetical protein Leryth_013585 [Lithospermum erythrorhizon]
MINPRIASPKASPYSFLSQQYMTISTIISIAISHIAYTPISAAFTFLAKCIKQTSPIPSTLQTIYD